MGLTAAAALLLALTIGAQTDTVVVDSEPTRVASAMPASVSRAYTHEHPLIYEDAQDLWPYAFLNENGQPDGFNVELIRLLLDKLHIPYEIRMKPRMTAFRDLKNGQSDLMIGLSAGFHEVYARYSQNPVTLFTQSILSPKRQPTQVHTFYDLANHKVYVSDSSLCHHLMIDYGWGDNAIPTRNISETILQMSTDEEGELVWNTLSLKWMLRKYHIDNLEITPVNMPHGECRFMANDQQLLDQLDSIFTELSTADKILPLQNKWFYPERQKPETPSWVAWVTGGTLLLLLLALLYLIFFRIQAQRIRKKNLVRNRRLALILETSRVRLWTYDVKIHQFAWRNEDGQTAYTYTMEEFSTRYSPEDFKRLKNSLNKLAATPPGKDAEEITLELKAKDVEGGDKEIRDYMIVLSVLERDKGGHPRLIIGTKKDITEERRLQRQSNERTLRYWSIFQTPTVGILLFNSEGILINLNIKACELLHCEPDEIIDEQVSVDDLLDTDHIDLNDCDDYFATQIVDLDKIPAEERKVHSIKRTGKLCNEFRLMSVRNEANRLVGIFAICRDMGHYIEERAQLNNVMLEVADSRQVLEQYNTSINSVLQGGDVRLVSYSPGSHTLTIFRSVDQVQHALTQTRCMTLVDDKSKSQAMRLLNDMDARLNKPIDVGIATTLRVSGKQLCLFFHMMPIMDRQGTVTDYRGICCDKSELNALEQQTAVQTEKALEVEKTQNSFIKNMVQEIRTPMNTVLNYVESLDENTMQPNEADMCQGIVNNSDRLLHLIDNILYLSRLQAHMVEIKTEPRNFAETFETQCENGWQNYKNNRTRYVVENPYQQLVIDIDIDNLGRAIAHIAANAAQHTHSGVIRARYDYIGRRLVISIDDTGEGIPADELERINKSDSSTIRNTHGLGLSITKELIRQMGGTVDVSSEEGMGTTVYIMIPCHATDIKRKKFA